MARILKRPMFNRGGSTNNGIMTGLVDRKGYDDGNMVTDVQETLPGLEEIIRDYTPKVKLPLGEVGLNLISGKYAGDGLLRNIAGSATDPYKKFVAADDAREASIRGGAAKLAIQRAMSNEKFKMQQMLKDPRIATERKVDYVKKVMGFETDKEALEYINTSMGDVSKQTPETRVQSKLGKMAVPNRNKAEYLVFLDPNIPAAKRSGKYILSDKNQFPKKPIQGKTYFDINKGILYEFVGGTPNDINSYVDVTEKYNKENFVFN